MREIDRQTYSHIFSHCSMPRWFGHVNRRLADAAVRRNDMVTRGSNTPGRGRTKLA